MSDKKHPEIPLKAVTSSQIEAIGYDAPTNTLAIKFKTGGLYHYADYPQKHWDQFSAAESVGSFFHKNIRGQFTHTRLGEKQAA